MGDGASDIAIPTVDISSSHIFPPLCFCLEISGGIFPSCGYWWIPMIGGSPESPETLVSGCHKAPETLWQRFTLLFSKCFSFCISVVGTCGLGCLGELGGSGN